MDILIEKDNFYCLKPASKDEYGKELLSLIDNGFRVYNKCSHFLELTDGKTTVNLLIPKEKEVQL